MQDHEFQSLDALLNEAILREASDLHLSSGMPPYIRIHGCLTPLKWPQLQESELEAMVTSLMSVGQQSEFQEKQTLDLAYSWDQQHRFRINVFRERGRLAMAIRRLEQRFRSLDELNLPPQLGDFVDMQDGLVLVTGPTGSGKSTTLATLLNGINVARTAHIITIEDPIEFVHTNHRSLVRQRELYTDVPSFAEAIRASLREDPDVILVGEMRDRETVAAAITAAETGHLVFSTLHTGSAVGTLERILGVFSGYEQEAIRQQLSNVLRAVVAQRLVPTAKGDARVPVVELLNVTPAVANLIRSGKPEQVYSLIEAGGRMGMQTLEQSLCERVRRDEISLDRAMRMARDPQSLEARLGQAPAVASI